MLQSAGVAQYEISNFARAGFESLHNSAYWEHRPYAGLGPSAASFINHRRTKNAASLPRYLAALENRRSPVEFVEVLTPELLATERLWLGLRTSRGVPAAWIDSSVEFILQQATSQGLLTTDAPGRITLTRKGMAVADEVVKRLLPTAKKIFASKFDLLTNSKSWNIQSALRLPA
jgi:oxygen-independent coproporphyrinogen-3 oxidase